MLEALELLSDCGDKMCKTVKVFEKFLSQFLIKLEKT